MTDQPELRGEPDPNDCVQMDAHRVIQAVYREYEGDAQVPRFVVVIESPPDGRVGIATSADDAVDAHRITTLLAASLRNAMTPEQKAAARIFWDTMRAGFENPN